MKSVAAGVAGVLMGSFVGYWLGGFFGASRAEPPTGMDSYACYFWGMVVGAIGGSAITAYYAKNHAVSAASSVAVMLLAGAASARLLGLFGG